MNIIKKLSTSSIKTILILKEVNPLFGIFKRRVLASLCILPIQALLSFSFTITEIWSFGDVGKILNLLLRVIG